MNDKLKFIGSLQNIAIVWFDISFFLSFFFVMTIFYGIYLFSLFIDNFFIRWFIHCVEYVIVQQEVCYAISGVPFLCSR
jgi:hypothetical protein